MTFTEHAYEAELPQGELELIGVFQIDPTNRQALLLNCHIGGFKCSRAVSGQIIGATNLDAWEATAFDTWADKQDDFWDSADEAYEAAQ
jgi:hypothetical protein